MRGLMSDPSKSARQPSLTRRRVIRTGAVGAGALAAAPLLNHGALARDRAKPVARDGSFDWGVSAGFPLPTSNAVALTLPTMPSHGDQDVLQVTQASPTALPVLVRGTGVIVLLQ